MLSEKPYSSISVRRSASFSRRMKPAGVDADYDLAYEHFDVLHFLLQARHMQSSESVDPLEVFLRNGARAKAGRSARVQSREGGGPGVE